MSTVRARSHESKLYHQCSKFYELLFTRFFRERIHSTIASLRIPAGARVLEVGVGTGLSLAAYPAHAEVTAIDLSAEMLAQAAEKLTENDWNHIQLKQMDALNLTFPDEHFDFVMAFHVVSVVPDHGRLIDQIVRVAKPGGTIVIINHFRSEKRWLAPLVDLIDPVTRRLGWRTTLRYSDIVGQVPLRIERRFKTSSRSLFTVVMAIKEAAAEPCARRKV